jgi:nitrogen fixation/metabolism regulation signal transduction histidine kinase
MASNVRGSGVRFTLPYVVRFSGLWLLVTSVAIVLFGVACYSVALQAGEALTEEVRSHLMVVLTVQTIVLLVAAVALAIFTTHRLAGPFVALQRAMHEIRDGDLDKPLRLRATDLHLRELETSFNEMKSAVRARLAEASRGPGA